MAFRTFLIFGLIVLLTACAQIGTLTGGAKDTTAPQPISDKVIPENGTTNYFGHEIKIPFNEFVKLNNVAENIILVPPHTKINATLHKKELTLSWKDSLQINTTYAIYMNRAVKDITENNDSLMQFVFSTGPIIDSLTYGVKVIDAFTNVPVSGCLVALYTGKTDSILPSYFAQTDKNGFASLKYLKNGNYSLQAFEDKNKDLQYQKTERTALRLSKISLDSSILDTVPLRMFTPLDLPKLSTIKYQAPGLFEVEATRDVKDAEIFVNRRLLTKNEYRISASNKFTFCYSVKDTSIKEVEVIFQNTWLKDTISTRILEKEKTGKLKIGNNLVNNSLYEKDTLNLNFTDAIASVNKDLFHLKNKKDSSLIQIDKITFNQNEVQIIFLKKTLKEVQLTIQPNGITTPDAVLKDSLIIDFSIKESKDFGAINLDLSAYQQPIVVEILLGESVIRTINFKNGGKKLIETLEPNDYKFRVIIDENQNGRWDVGDLENKKLPEEIHLFIEPTKVRANWEIDLKLIPKTNNE
ncbi:MAG: Ig-like domain-containing protein [Flavobacteriia bacterium]|nr:Ig-like domain-containing protein [Flavobacteriia bacterium]